MRLYDVDPKNWVGTKVRMRIEHKMGLCYPQLCDGEGIVESIAGSHHVMVKFGEWRQDCNIDWFDVVEESVRIERCPHCQALVVVKDDKLRKPTKEEMNEDFKKLGLVEKAER